MFKKPSAIINLGESVPVSISYDCFSVARGKGNACHDSTLKIRSKFWFGRHCCRYSMSPWIKVNGQAEKSLKVSFANVIERGQKSIPTAFAIPKCSARNARPPPLPQARSSTFKPLRVGLH